MMTVLTLKKYLYDQIVKQAEIQYPEECCGWILDEFGFGPSKYVIAENLQNKYHKLDPEGYPATAKNAFLMNAIQMEYDMKRVFEKGGSLFSIVHSHIDAEAYFSSEDIRLLSTPDGQKPIYDVACYIVLATNLGKVLDHALYTWDIEKKNFKKGILKIV